MFKSTLCLAVCAVGLSLQFVAPSMARSQSPAKRASEPINHTRPTGTAAAQTEVAPTPEQRLRLLEERMDTVLALKDEEIQELKDRIDYIYKLVGLVGGLAALVIVFLTVRDAIIRNKEGERQRGLDDIVKKMMGLQQEAMGQQLSLGAIHLQAAADEPVRYLQRMENVNQVIDTVQKTLAFRLVQEKKVAEVLKIINKQEAERERKNKQKWESVLNIFENFKTMSRMQFASLTPEQQKRATKLVEIVGDLEDYLKDLKVKEFEVVGHLLYTCGVIAYYDNDVIQARTYLNRAAECQAPNHQAELSSNEGYRKRFVLIHYYRALIQKNWGELTDALLAIEQSIKLLGTSDTEFLTPTTKAEIMSYIDGDEKPCRIELTGLLQRINDLEEARKVRKEELDPNQKRLRNRLLILLGNTHFVLHEHQNALKQYNEALAFNQSDYYALASAALCYSFLGNPPKARESFSSCLTAIESSGDFYHKRERITRAVIAVLAAIAAKGYGNQSSYHRWTIEARELLEGDLTIDDLSPKFFSPLTKHLVSSTELLNAMKEFPMAATSVSPL